MNKKIRVGIIGFGGIGNFHSMAINGNPDCELAAIFDPSPQAREKAVKSFPGAAICETLEQLLAVAGLKAVIIATPNNLHAQYSVAAAKKKLHVLCEKPLAMNAAEAAKMLKAAKDARVVHMANFGYRNIPAFRYAKSMVKQGMFGKITRMRAEFIQGFLRNPDAPIAWRNLKQFAGLGALGDLGSHMIDAVIYLTGAKPKRAIGIHRVTVGPKNDPATGKKVKVTADTDAQFMVDFGTFSALFETSQVECGPEKPLTVALSGDRGSFRVSAGERLNWDIALDKESRGTTPMVKTEIPEQYREEIPFGRHFILAIQKKTRDIATFEDGLIVQKTLDAVDRSMTSGKWEPIR